MKQLPGATDPMRPVLIAGPTASGKSALALAIAERHGGVIVNADAIQVFANWRVLTARPTVEDEARAPHRLYGHVDGEAPYSVGQWMRDLEPILSGPDRVIIVGGTGLYFSALTEGLADIPQTPDAVRVEANARLAAGGLAAMIAELDDQSAGRIDLQNPMRVQRAWEVLQSTGRGIAAWQDETKPPRLRIEDCDALRIDAPKDWLTPRIERRFDAMLAGGAMEEAQANLPDWDPDSHSAKAIGAAELIAHLRGEMSLSDARDLATVATRQFAKRQRTWFKARMKGWQGWDAAQLAHLS